MRQKTITTCQNCNAPIKGDQYKPYHDYLGPSTEAPYYCDNCGKEFPWTKILLSKTIELNEEPVKWIENLVNRFNLVIKRLEQKRNNKRLIKVTDEYDLQGLLHALLFLRFDDIRPEDPTPILAGRSARLDFVLKEEEAVLELKIAKPGHDDKEIGEELLKDIAKYSERQDCETLIFFIYDKEGVFRTGKDLKEI